MKQLFWNNGRLGWPFVFWVVFMTVSLVALDLVWRGVNVSAKVLLPGAALCLVVGSVLILRRGRADRPS